MKNERICDVCLQDDLQVLGVKVYERASIEKHDDYDRARYKVLFEQWFPEKEAVKLEIVLCQNCGFIFYLPRPEVKDIDDKYKYLQRFSGESNGDDPFGPIDVKRANLIYGYLRSVIDLSRIDRVLDFGGNDGRLMKPFAAAGKSCFLLDYNQTSVTGVTKLGDTIEDLQEKEAFDLIYCSHLLEHIADPRETIEKLLTHLTPDGYLFVEVPMEIIARLPMQSDPVTHINFFSPNSLANLLTQSGCRLADCRLESCLHSSGKWNFGIRAIGRKYNAKAGALDQIPLKKPDAMNYIKPDFSSKLKFIQMNPGMLKRFLIFKIKKYLRLAKVQESD